MKKILFLALTTSMLGMAGCQSTAPEGASPAQSSKSVPATFDLGSKKIFLSSNVKVEQKDYYSNTNKGSFTETNNRTGAMAVLIRQNGNNLLVADPDNQAGTVFVNGKSVKTSGSISGKGRTNCVKLEIEEGYKRNICSRYTYSNGIVEISEEEKDPAEDRTTKRTYKFAYDGNSCRFISFSEFSNAKNGYCDGPCLGYYGGKTKWRYTINSTSTSGNCSIR